MYFVSFFGTRNNKFNECQLEYTNVANNNNYQCAQMCLQMTSAAKKGCTNHSEQFVSATVKLRHVAVAVAVAVA